MDLEHSTIKINGIRLHVVQAGPKSGVPILLLHGFPEFWYGWRKQIPSLAAAGCSYVQMDDYLDAVTPMVESFFQTMYPKVPQPRNLVYVPPGCAHGYLTIHPDTEVYYLTSAAYAPGSVYGVRYDDPLFNIELPAPVTVISDADRGWPDAAP